MSPPELHLVATARPDLPGLAALWHALPSDLPLRPVLVQAGAMPEAAGLAADLTDLGLPPPGIVLGIAGTSPAERVGHGMLAAAAPWQRHRPALVVVAGDADAALAATLAARKLGLPLACLEAGRRGGDAALPEAVNRRAMEAVATLLWARDEADAARLLAEGHAPGQVRAVGNAMVDSLLRSLPLARLRPLPPRLQPGTYGVIALHQAASPDSTAVLAPLLHGLEGAAALLPLVWPLPPRLRRRLARQGLAVPEGVRLLPPLPYLDSLGLLARARLVVTDSEAVREEALALDLPGLGTEALEGSVRQVLAGAWPQAQPIPLWDGRAGARMVAHLRDHLGL